MEAFLTLIDELNICAPATRAEVERRICEIFQVERAVLALDMSGYSFSVRRGGILPHLCKIRRMQQLVSPLIERFDGQVVKQVADNILAVFLTPKRALDAAIAINQLLAAPQLPEDALLRVAIGIDYGPFLLVPQYDAFGDPVNIAYKLGEDVAGPGEILLTASARQLLGNDRALPLEELTLSISGIELLAYRVSVRALPGSAPAAAGPLLGSQGPHIPF